MKNIFVPFDQRYINAIMAKQEFYLVSQTYKPFKGEIFIEGKKYIMLSPYSDLIDAKQHFQYLRDKKDPFAAILDLRRQEHKAKLIELVHFDSGYFLYLAAIKSATELEKLLNSKYKENLRLYIEHKTRLHFHRDIVLNPVLKLKFGELIIALQHRGQKVELYFDELADTNMHYGL